MAKEITSIEFRRVSFVDFPPPIVTIRVNGKEMEVAIGLNDWEQAKSTGKELDYLIAKLNSLFRKIL